MSLANTMLIRRAQFHQSRLLSASTFTDRNYHSAVQGLASRLVHEGLNPIVATHRAAAMIYNTVQNQATMLSYIDVFKALGVAAFFFIALIVFLKRIPARPAVDTWGINPQRKFGRPRHRTGEERFHRGWRCRKGDRGCRAESGRVAGPGCGLRRLRTPCREPAG